MSDYEGVPIRRIADDIGEHDDRMGVKGHGVRPGAGGKKRQQQNQKLKQAKHKRRKPRIKFEEDPLDAPKRTDGEPE